MRTDVPEEPRSTVPGSAKKNLEPDSGSPDPSGAALDPAGPEKVPNKPKPNPAAEENPYSPDFKSEPEPKPHHDADIDTPGG